MTSPEHIQTPQCLMFKYRYERLLGEGTNGKTYLATDLRTGSLLAIKALKLNQSENFKSFELFKREAETLASLQVTGIPKFYESILAEDVGGECYIVQEYIDAPSIQSQLAQGRIFSEAETLTVMQKAAEILHILHTQYAPPIIHRDIKPSNILCDLHDEAHAQDAPLYLIDFGAVANARSNTDKSTIAGTIGYMAPEQNFGECLPQTDLYALGATALHMLTGVPPYEMDFETYSIKYNDAIDEHAPETSTQMRDLLGKLLNYAYDKRPASAAELLKNIQDIRDGNGPLVPQSEEEKMALRLSNGLATIINFFYLCPKLGFSNALIPKEQAEHGIVPIKNSVKLDHAGKRSLFNFLAKIYNLPQAILNKARTPNQSKFQFNMANKEYIRYAIGTAYAVRNFDVSTELWHVEQSLQSTTVKTCVEFTFDAPCVEFTFDVHGVTWNGMSRKESNFLPNKPIPENTFVFLDNAYQNDFFKLPESPKEADEWLKTRTVTRDIHTQPFPVKCLVQYKVDDPSFCDLIYLIPVVPNDVSVKLFP
ncbi:MAG: serine/threonine protein kinase [Proteobacteria bacterium]|nr:serine/threonine protein kinase [Pseudomonadota bacterium]